MHCFFKISFAGASVGSNLVPQELCFEAHDEQHQLAEHLQCTPSSPRHLLTSCMSSHGLAMRCRRMNLRRQGPVDNSRQLHKMEQALHSRPMIILQRRATELLPLRVPADPANGSQMIRWDHLAFVRSQPSACLLPMSAPFYVCSQPARSDWVTLAEFAADPRQT